jgi:hypothetical protein
MRPALFATVAVLALAACGNASPQGYKALPLPEESFALPQDVFASALRRFPEGREGRQEMDLTLRKAADGSYVVLLTRTGFLDDSVEGEQRRAVLRFEGGGWQAVELGERWRCYAGRGPGSWTTKPCN